jgi:hypothetical protein
MIFQFRITPKVGHQRYWGYLAPSELFGKQLGILSNPDLGLAWVEPHGMASRLARVSTTSPLPPAKGFYFLVRAWRAVGTAQRAHESQEGLSFTPPARGMKLLLKLETVWLV